MATTRFTREWFNMSTRSCSEMSLIVISNLHQREIADMVSKKGKFSLNLRKTGEGK